MLPCKPVFSIRRLSSRGHGELARNVLCLPGRVGMPIRHPLRHIDNIWIRLSNTRRMQLVKSSLSKTFARLPQPRFPLSASIVRSHALFLGIISESIDLSYMIGASSMAGLSGPAHSPSAVHSELDLRRLHANPLTPMRTFRHHAVFHVQSFDAGERRSGPS